MGGKLQCDRLCEQIHQEARANFLQTAANKIQNRLEGVVLSLSLLQPSQTFTIIKKELVTFSFFK